MIATRRMVRYCYEGFFLYMVFALIYKFLEGFPPSGAFVVAYLFPAFALLFLLRNRKETVPAVWLLLSFVVFAAFAWVLGFPLFLAVVLAALSTWRAFSYLFNYSTPSEGPNGLILVLVSLAIVLFLYIFSTGYPHFKELLFVLIAQFLFFFGMMFFENLAELGADAANQRSKYVRWGFGSLAGLSVLSVLLLLFYPVVKWVFFSGLWIAAQTIGRLIAYPIWWFLNALFGWGSGDLSDLFGEAKSAKREAEKMQQMRGPDDSGFPVEWLWIILICIFIALVIYFLRKKMYISRATVSEPDNTEKLASRWKGRRRRRGKPPKDEVRRRFFQLQKKLADSEVGRSAHESVGDWFSRLDLDPEEKKIIAADYRKVRYGNASLSAEELERYERAVGKLIEQAKKEKKEKKKDD